MNEAVLSMKTFVRPYARTVIAATLSCGVATHAAAQTPDLANVSLRELMGIEVQHVFGASERLQPVTEAPSAVTIVTAEEIRRFGYRSLADILRGVRGFYVSDDRNYGYIGVRGFSRAGDYNTRVLLLLNGHRLNDNIFDQAAISAELMVDVATIERVEIIRGPASSLYGTSAFFGVINIITRSGADLDGGSVTVGAGTLGSTAIRAAAGRRLTNGVDVMLSASAFRSDGVAELTYPEFRDLGHPDGIARGLDGERAASILGQVSFRGLTLTGVTGVRHKDVPTASFGTIFNAQDPHQNTDDERQILTAVFERQVGSTKVALSGSFNRFAYAGRYPFEAEALDGPYVFDDSVDGRRVTVGARASRALPGRQTVTAGAELLANIRQVQRSISPVPEDQRFRRDTSRFGAIFVQDEIEVASWLRLSAGLRHDDHGRFQRTTPRAAVIVGRGGQVVKYLYGRAFRAPNVYERTYWEEASAGLQPETIDTHEVVWERYSGNWLRTSVAGYWYDASRLISFRAVDPDDMLYAYVNEGRITSRGVEAEAEIRLNRWLQAFGSYVGQRTRDGRGERLANSPAHLGTVRATVGDRSGARFASIEMLQSSGRLTRVATGLPRTVLVNATAGVPLTRSFALIGTVRNLLDRRIYHPASDEHVMEAIEQNGRTARVDLQWTFGAR